MADFFKNINKEKVVKYSKYVFLTLAALGMLCGALLLFVPYCAYPTAWKKDGVPEISIPMGMKNLVPIKAFSLLQDMHAKDEGAAYLALVLFIVIILAVAFAAFLFTRVVIAFLRDDNSLSKRTGKLLLCTTLMTGIYFISAIIGCAIINFTDGYAERVSNAYPFILSLLVTTAYAAFVGLLKKWNTEQVIEQETQTEKKEKARAERVAIYKARVELLAFMLVIMALAVVALLSNIATITYEEVMGITPPDPIKLSGAKLLGEYLTLDEGGRTVAFIIMALLTLIGSMAFLAAVSFLSRSNLFYKISVATIAFSVLAAFLVGMFGKYYQVTGISCNPQPVMVAI